MIKPLVYILPPIVKKGKDTTKYLYAGAGIYLGNVADKFTIKTIVS